MLSARDKQSNALARYSLLAQRIGTLPRPFSSSGQLNWAARSRCSLIRAENTAILQCKKRKRPGSQCGRIGDVPWKLLVRPPRVTAVP